MKLVSYIIPIYNEDKNIPVLYKELAKFLEPLRGRYNYEIIFVNDGSTDKSAQIIENLTSRDEHIKYLEFSRNFGKEIAITAGLNHCKGEAAICLDADLQHPIAKILDFLLKWENGADVVIGVRKSSKSDTFIKRIGSWFFYKIMSRISETHVMPNSTDFRLLNRKVINEFNRLTEKNRITRGLIDWLGFRREYVHFDAGERTNGRANYSFFRLLRLAFSSFVSLSFFPLRIAGYLGILITLASGTLGLYIFVTKYIFKISQFTWPAILAVINLFLIGVVLTCLGLIALYIANIHTEVSGRPMYVVRKKSF